MDKKLLIIGDDFKMVEEVQRICEDWFGWGNVFICSHSTAVDTDDNVVKDVLLRLFRPTHIIILECDVEDGKENVGIKTWQQIKSSADEWQIIVPCGHYPVSDERAIKLPIEPLELKKKFGLAD